MSEERVPLTDEQVAERVRDLSRSWVMTSGAGCGKTYQMVQRYVAIIEAGVDVTRIIAVTFTEKAAAELKARVRGKCREMAGDRGLPAEERERWTKAARQLSLAPVTTIHGLCARLLRENAVAAGLDPRFTPLDETAQQMLLDETVREMLLERLHAGEKTAQAVVARWGLGGAQTLLGGLVNDREEIGRLLTEPPSAQELLARWEAECERAYSDVLDRLMSSEQWAEAAACLLSVETCEMEDDAAKRHCRAVTALEIVTDEARPVGERVSAFGECLAAARKGNVGRKDNWAGRLEDHETIKSGLLALSELKDACKEAKIVFPALEDEETAGLASAVLVEARAALRAYEAAAREASALDFADLQIKARDLLLRQPEVLARVRRRYEHVLVDEFQDTNRLQREIVWLIAGGDPVTGAPPARGGLFVVGDAKQSIYGFRNADVTVFNETIDGFEGYAVAGSIPLEVTRRSHPGLVGFFNDLFARPEVMGCERKELFEAHYEAVRAHRAQHAMPADAELILIPQDELGGGDEEDGANTRDTRIREAEVLAARIRELVDDPSVRVLDRDSGECRRAEYRDFGMLFQAMSDVGIYEYALRRAGVPFYTVAGRGFFNRQEVRDCLSLLRVLESTADEVALVGALRSPLFGLSDDTIFFLTREMGPLVDALRLAADGQHSWQEHLRGEQPARIRRAREVIERLRAVRHHLGLSELVERMLAETGLAALHLTQFAGRQAAANLGKLVELARSFEEGGAFSLREFITYLSDLVLQEHREGLADVFEEAANVVKLMTVHKAKGLEWPIVIVPDLGRTPRGGGESVLVDARLGVVPKMEDREGNQSRGAIGEIIRARSGEREEAERRRLLYVAATRARDMLIMSSGVSLNKDGGLKRGGLWLQWVTEGLGIDCAEVEDGSVLGSERWRLKVRRLVEGPALGGSERLPRAPLSLIDDALDAAEAGDVEPLPRRVREISPADLPARSLSVTALQDYRKCPRLFYLRHMLGLAEAPGGGDWLQGVEASQRGNIAHRALEMIGREGMIADRDSILQTLEIAARESGLALLPPQHRKGLFEAIEWFLTEEGLYEQWIAGAGRLRAEVRFAVPLAGITVEGTIDALAEDHDGAWRILDYKTSARATSEEQIAGYRGQVGLYCAAVEGRTGALPADAALVLLDDRRLCRVSPIEAAGEALRVLEETVAGLQAGEFEPRDGCDVQHCPLAYACR